MAHRTYDRHREYLEAVRAGERSMPPLDSAACKRGSSAQAQAHRRRGEKPCPRCLEADRRDRTHRRREQRARATDQGMS